MRNLTKKQGLREEAKLVMWNYYKENKDRLPKWIRECREEILMNLINGVHVDAAFKVKSNYVAHDTFDPN